MQKKTHLNFEILPIILFNPKKAFKQLEKKATIEEGLAMTLLLSAIATGITVLSGVFYGTPPESQLFIALGLILGVFLSVAIIAVAGWLAAMIAGIIFKGKGDVKKTIALLGYSTILSIAFALLSSIAVYLGR